MFLQDYTPVINILETLKCSICRPKSNIKFNREFVHLLWDSKESSTWISKKAVNI